MKSDVSKENNWPRLRDLPADKQKPFKEWIRGQTVPFVVGIPMKDQDFYYPWDYERWKAGLPIIDQ